MRIGDEITVVINNGNLPRGHPDRVKVVRAHVRLVWSIEAGSRKFGFRTHTDVRGWRLRRDEGITWCRGWEGPAVNALHAALALSSVA